MPASVLAQFIYDSRWKNHLLSLAIDKPAPRQTKSLGFLNVHDIRHGAHQYGKDWVPFGLLATSRVSGLGLLFIIGLRHFRVLKTRNVSNLL